MRIVRRIYLTYLLVISERKRLQFTPAAVEQRRCVTLTATYESCIRIYLTGDDFKRCEKRDTPSAQEVCDRRGARS